MRLQSAHPLEIGSRRQSVANKQAACASEHLIAASGVRPGDRVLVFGYNVLDHLVDLARSGIDRAMGVYAGQPYRPREPVDVVWFTRVGDSDAEVVPALGGVAAARLIAVELRDHTEFAAMRRLIVGLRARGFGQTSYYKAAGRFILTAWRSAGQYRGDLTRINALKAARGAEALSSRQKYERLQEAELRLRTKP